jgi:hypothetical protein
VNTWKQTEAARELLARETGTIHKDHGGRLSVALTYPNSYHVGMSSLALQILYRLLNSDPNSLRARVWDRRRTVGLPLFPGITTAVRVRICAFTISFEMDYFNLAMPGSRRHSCRVVSGRPGLKPHRYPLIAGGPASQ